MPFAALPPQGSADTDSSPDNFLTALPYRFDGPIASLVHTRDMAVVHRYLYQESRGGSYKETAKVSGVAALHLPSCWFLLLCKEPACITHVLWLAVDQMAFSSNIVPYGVVPLEPPSGFMTRERRGKNARIFKEGLAVVRSSSLS